MRSIKQLTEREAVAIGVGLPISKKFSIEISQMIKGKDVQKAKKFLEDVIEMKRAVPCKRIGSVGHKKGIGPGSYPIKAATYILKILKSAEANANQKGLNVESLIIKYFIANQGSRSYHYGRRRGLKTKSTHIEIVVEEVTKKAEKKVEKKAEQPEKKTEDKPSEPQAKPKETEEKAPEKKVEEKVEPKKEEAKPETPKEEKKEEAKSEETKK